MLQNWLEYSKGSSYIEESIQEQPKSLFKEYLYTYSKLIIEKIIKYISKLNIAL